MNPKYLFFLLISPLSYVFPVYIDFDSSMGITTSEHEAELQKKLEGYDYFTDFYDYIKEHYTSINFNTIVPSQQFLIPPIIHHIWLGSKLPERFHIWRTSWMKKHPHWVYILWTDNESNYHHGTRACNTQELQRFLKDESYQGATIVCHLNDFPLYNQHLYNRAKNYGERSDIVRLEVLHQLGGLYIDTDFECINSFDLLHKSCTFYTGLVPLDSASILPNGIIGCQAHHPTIFNTMHVLHTIPQGDGKLIFPPDLKGIIDRGPRLLGKQIYHYLKNHLKNPYIVILPASYFFPISSTCARYYERDMSPEVVLKFIRPETLAVHHWCASWTFPSGNVR